MTAEEIAGLNDIIEQEFHGFRIRLGKIVRDFIEERDFERENDGVEVQNDKDASSKTD